MQEKRVYEWLLDVGEKERRRKARGREREKEIEREKERKRDREIERGRERERFSPGVLVVFRVRMSWCVLVQWLAGSLLLLLLLLHWLDWLTHSLAH